LRSRQIAGKLECKKEVTMTRSPAGRRLCGRCTGILVLALIALLAAPGARAQTVVDVEAEDYTSADNIGGYDIQSVICSGASGGMAADGIDIVGEWIQLLVPFPKAGCYRIEVAFQGYPDQENAFTASLVSGGDSALLEFVGAGIGCDFEYIWDEGSAQLCVDAAEEQFVRLALSGGGRSRVDLARFTFIGTPAGTASWSLVKSAYR
jgi:hypothetical protein